jgi:putative tributyrin esterase
MKSQFFTTEKAAHGDLEFITVKSNALNNRGDICVFNPFDSEVKDVPIVILLHGVYGSHWAWSIKGTVHKTMAKLIKNKKVSPMLLVMPSDGLYQDGSGYVPHKKADYEKWIVEDVINCIKEQYPIVSKKSKIFITGLSMGGYGALRLGAKYPKLFKAFSGLSSITHFDQIGQFVSDFKTLKRDAIEKDGVIDWMIKNKKQLSPFRFDCGADDPLIQFNRQLNTDLIDNKIKHIYEEFGGGHSWEYWQRNIISTFLFFNDILESKSK